MEDKKVLLDHIDKIHTTELGIERIKRNLKLDTQDVVAYCRNKILDKNCHIYYADRARSGMLRSSQPARRRRTG